jgi:predicted RNase H-like HicB family nuclease
LKKDLEYYMELNYMLEVTRLPEGGFIIAIPDLGIASMNAYGDSFEEAFETLEELKKDSFARWINGGLPIQEPLKEGE